MGHLDAQAGYLDKSLYHSGKHSDIGLIGVYFATTESVYPNSILIINIMVFFYMDRGLKI
jgi:hypothetical protein